MPTSAEAGIPDYLMTVWIGVVAPAGTPQPIVDRVHALVQGMLKDETMVKRMAGAAIDVMPMSQRDFAAFVKDEYGALGEDREGRRRRAAIGAPSTKRAPM